MAAEAGILPEDWPRKEKMKKPEESIPAVWKEQAEDARENKRRRLDNN